MISDRICRSGSPCSQIVPQSHFCNCSSSPFILPLRKSLFFFFLFFSLRKSLEVRTAPSATSCARWSKSGDLRRLTRLEVIVADWSLWRLSELSDAVKFIRHLERHNTRHRSSSRLHHSCRRNIKWPSLDVTHLSLWHNWVNCLFSELS